MIEKFPRDCKKRPIVQLSNGPFLMVKFLYVRIELGSIGINRKICGGCRKSLISNQIDRIYFNMEYPKRFDSRDSLCSLVARVV